VDAEAKCVVLAGSSLADVNSFDEPRKIAPLESQIAVAGLRFQRNFTPHSFTVLRLRAQ
jgi:alpha-L-arabinofuranosidase